MRQPDPAVGGTSEDTKISHCELERGPLGAVISVFDAGRTRGV